MEEETSVVNEEQVTDAPQAAEEVSEEVAVKPGDKTDPNLLLKSLREEREEVKRLKAELAQKNESEQTGEVFSDEGKALLNRISSLEAKLSSKEERDQLAVLETKFAPLKDKASEFEDFRNNPENAGMRLETAAKAFLLENDLLEGPAPRKGLEKAGGGTRVPIASDRMTPEEVDTLRNTNYRKYSDMVRKGQIKI